MKPLPYIGGLSGEDEDQPLKGKAIAKERAQREQEAVRAANPKKAGSAESNQQMQNIKGHQPNQRMMINK